MLNHHSNRLLSIACVLTTILIMPILANVPFAYAQEQQPVTHSLRVELNAGDSLLIHSDRSSIQRVLLEGNLTNASLTKPQQYPATDFGITTKNAGTLNVKVLFDYASDYGVIVSTRISSATVPHSNATYYVSGGTFELDITVVIDASVIPQTGLSSVSPWDSFSGWMGKFSEAFPFWVKALYMIFGIQFFTVGGLWIRRETRKKETGTQPLDSGDKTFLWTDIVYKFLLVSFLAIITIMGGELLVLFILRFMFLVTLDWLSLWDLFVVGFAAGVVIIAYVAKFTLEKAFDLRPLEDE